MPETCLMPVVERPRRKIRRRPLASSESAWMRSFDDAGPIDVSVCIANWNCRELLRGCLESLHDLPQGVRVETIVVDNGSADGAADMVAREFPEVILVRNTANTFSPHFPICCRAYGLNAALVARDMSNRPYRAKTW